jgi:heavy metal efflux system protein
VDSSSSIRFLVEPAKLRKFDLTLHEVYEAVAKNNANAGGNVLERHAERAIVRGVGLIKSMSDIELIIVKESGGTPIFVRDVAEVRIGHAVRHGAVVLNGGTGSRDRHRAHASRR